MNSQRDFDRAVDQWLDDGSDATPPAVIDAVLLAARSTPQERDFRVPWRTTTMTSYLRVAAVIALVVIGSGAAIFTLGPAGFGGTGATPSPSPVLIARGNFVEHDFGPVEFEASRVGSSVKGQMTVGPNWSGSNTFAVDLQCARETEDGIVIIGGSITVGSEFMEVGAPAWIVIKRGAPHRASVGIPFEPGLETPDCLTNLERWWQDCRRMAGDGWEPMEVLGGGIEFGP